MGMTSDESPVCNGRCCHRFIRGDSCLDAHRDPDCPLHGEKRRAEQVDELAQMNALQVYSSGLDAIEWIVNCHTGNKREMKKALRLAVQAVRNVAFKKNFPELAHLTEGLGEPHD